MDEESNIVDPVRFRPGPSSEIEKSLHPRAGVFVFWKYNRKLKNLLSGQY
jgi:hypothetical protein